MGCAWSVQAKKETANDDDEKRRIEKSINKYGDKCFNRNSTDLTGLYGLRSQYSKILAKHPL